MLWHSGKVNRDHPSVEPHHLEGLRGVFLHEALLEFKTKLVSSVTFFCCKLFIFCPADVCRFCWWLFDWLHSHPRKLTCKSQIWWSVGRRFSFSKGPFSGSTVSLHGYELLVVLLLGIQSELDPKTAQADGWRKPPHEESQPWGVLFEVSFEDQTVTEDGELMYCNLSMLLEQHWTPVEGFAILVCAQFVHGRSWEPGEDLRPCRWMLNGLPLVRHRVDAKKDFCRRFTGHGGKIRQHEMKLMSRSGHDQYWWSTYLPCREIAYSRRPFGEKERHVQSRNLLVKGHVSSLESVYL